MWPELEEVSHIRTADKIWRLFIYIVYVVIQITEKCKKIRSEVNNIAYAPTQKDTCLQKSNSKEIKCFPKRKDSCEINQHNGRWKIWQIFQVKLFTLPKYRIRTGEVKPMLHIFFFTLLKYCHLMTIPRYVR